MIEFVIIEYLGSDDPVGDWWKCSCDKEVFIPDEGDKYKYCPFCGGEIKFIARNNEE
jgi:hypothetical protein